MAVAPIKPCLFHVLRWLLPRAVLLAIAALAIGCAGPEPLVRMTPLSGNLVWVGGVQAAVKQNKSVRAGAAFVRQQGDLNSFHVEIENLSAAPIEVGPADFSTSACTLSSDGRTRTCGPAHLVVDPEQMLLDLDMAQARQAAENGNQAGAVGAFVILGLVAAMAGAAANNPAAGAAVAIPSAHMAGGMAAIEAEGQARQAAQETERAKWEAAALRRTTLPPGGRLVGLVYAQRDLAAREVRLAGKIAGESLEVFFKQTLIYPPLPHTTDREQVF
jgi:hypothetical protein